MAILIAYFSVVLIWATTPLAIQWSSDSIGFLAAVVLRMLIALVLALVILAVMRRNIFSVAGSWKIYLAGSIGVFPNMPLVYWAAQFIPSGLVAVIFALSPFVTGLMTLWLLKQNPFGIKRVLALLIALVGLGIIFLHQWVFDGRAALGVLGILGSCFIFCFSSVMVKKLTQSSSAKQVGAFNQLSGTLLFSLPGLLLTWWWFDGVVPSEIPTQSITAIAYLAIVGSLIGATLFFYILQRMSPSAVSLITLMTPVLAILLGKFAAAEVLSLNTKIGTALVLVALLLYMPWSLKVLAYSLSTFVERALRKPALTSEEYPQGELQNLKDEYIRYK